MLQLLISILGILITIFFVIGTHESAHFIAARLLGVKVLRFSIGFGKTLFRWTDKKGTEYVFALIPLGGYVKMLDEGEGNVPSEELPLAFNRQPFYKKFLIVLAGPFVNILCALILYWVIFMIGFVSIKPVIGEVTPHSIAELGGLKANQEIISIDNDRTLTWTGILLRIIAHVGNQDQLKIETKNVKNQKIETHVLDLSHWQLEGLKPDPLDSLGIIPYQPNITSGWPKELLNKNQYAPFTALTYAWKQIIDFTYFNLLLFGKMVTGKLSLQSLGGPITIFTSAGQALNYGFLSFMGFLAFLSVAIGVINLLPIPGLDGGHLFFQFIEFIIRRPLPEAIILFAYRLGIFLLLFLLIQSFVNDILRLY